MQKADLSFALWAEIGFNLFTRPARCKCSLNIMADQDNNDELASPKLAVVDSDSTRDEIDLSLLEDSLAKTPWERMLANDDALRFADSLRAAMEKRNAKPKSSG